MRAAASWSMKMSLGRSLKRQVHLRSRHLPVIDLDQDQKPMARDYRMLASYVRKEVLSSHYASHLGGASLLVQAVKALVLSVEELPLQSISEMLYGMHLRTPSRLR